MRKEAIIVAIRILVVADLTVRRIVDRTRTVELFAVIVRVQNLVVRCTEQRYYSTMHKRLGGQFIIEQKAIRIERRFDRRTECDHEWPNETDEHTDIV